MTKAEFFVDETLKESAEALFSRLGLSMSEAITLFLAQCDMQKGLPFEVEIPNEETQKALNEVHAGINVTSYDSVDALFEDLGI